MGNTRVRTMGRSKGGYYTVYRVNFCYRVLIILPISELALYTIDYTVECMSRYIWGIGLDDSVQWGR